MTRNYRSLVTIHLAHDWCTSDVFNSSGVAKYQIGLEDGSPIKKYNITEKEAHEILTNLPEELLEFVKAHYNLADVTITQHIPIVNVPTVEDVIVIPVGLDDGETLDLEPMTVEDLRSLARQLDIKGYSRMNKAELHEAINEIVDTASDEE